MNPFKAAQTKVIQSLGQKTETDLTWYGDQGWSSVYGGVHTSNDPPQVYEAFVLQAFRKNAVVRACVQELITSLSEAPIRAYTDTDDGSRSWIPHHPISELFEHPNDRDSYVEFIEKVAQHYFLGGNTFWEKRRYPGTGRIEKLIPIRPDKVVSAVLDKDGFPLAFKVLTGRDAVTTKLIKASDLVHIPDIDPLNEVFGMPRLLAALTEVQADNEATSYVNTVLHNHGSPGTVVAVDADKIRGQNLIERAEARWEERFSGPGRGKVAFLPGAHTVKEIGFNLKDLEFKEMRNVARSSICAVFGVDPMIIGVSSRGSTLSGNEHQEARRKLWSQTIRPLIRRWESAINAFLAPEYGNVKAGFDLREVGALQEDRNAAIERGTKLSRTGVATMYEIREEMGLDTDPLPDELIVVGGRIEYSLVDNLKKEPEVVDPPQNDSTENEESEENEETEAQENEEN